MGPAQRKGQDKVLALFGWGRAFLQIFGEPVQTCQVQTELPAIIDEELKKFC